MAPFYQPNNVTYHKLILYLECSYIYVKTLNVISKVRSCIKREPLFTFSFFSSLLDISKLNMSLGVQFLKRLALIFVCFGATCGNVIESFDPDVVNSYIKYRAIQLTITAVYIVLTVGDLLVQCCRKKSKTSTQGEIFSVILALVYIVSSTVVFYVSQKDKNIYGKLGILLHMASAVGIMIYSWAWGFHRGSNYQSVTTTTVIA